MLSNMDDMDSEESECFALESSEESSEEAPSSKPEDYKSFGVNVLQEEGRSTSINSLPIMRKYQPPNLLQKLYYREIGGIYAPGCHKTFSRINKPDYQRIRLNDILPPSAKKTNHVFLGISKCGQFLLSYTYTTELDVMSFNTAYKYRLHWWAFTPHQQARKVSEVMLFGNQGIYSTLFIAVCQWPLDHTRVLIYGNCCETYMGLVSQAERSYLTITTVPSINKCQDCLKVAASYEEEDVAANWDSCVRFSCLKHSVTVHSTFDIVSPYPKFDPVVSMKRDGTVVFNTGNQLHMLRAELEYVDKNSSSNGSRSDPVVAGGFVEPSSNDNSQNKNTEYHDVHDPWSEDIKRLSKYPLEKSSDTQNLPHFSCLCSTRAHSISPNISGPCEKPDDCTDGAISSTTSCTFNSTSELLDKCKYDDDDDDIDDEDVLEVKKCSEMDTNPSLQFPSDYQHGFIDSCDICSKKYCTRIDERDLEKNCVLTRKASDMPNSTNSCKKSCDTSKQCDTSSGRPELETMSVLSRTGREKAIDDFTIRVTRSQTSRERRPMQSESSFEEDVETEVPFYKKSIRSVEEFWARDGHTIDSTQELNISCGSINTGMNGNQSSITLMSPVQKPLLIISSSEEGRVGQPSDSCTDAKRSPSPPRPKRIRFGTTVKLSSPLPHNQPKMHSKVAADAEKAYEFTDDTPETTGEKLSTFRRRRLADKKYEFIEEGEDLENIVPYRLHRRREPTRHRSPPLLIPTSPVLLSHWRRHHEVDPDEVHITGQWTPSNLPYNSLTGEILAVGNHPEPDKVVLRPLNQNTSGPLLLSPRDRDSVTTDRAKNNNKKNVQTEVVPVSEDFHHPNNTEPVGQIVPSDVTDTNNSESISTQCTVQLKRRYIEVDDELISVITDIEDDEVNEGMGYHCALPLEVHGAGYVQLQMISNSKAEKLMAPCVTVLQRSFDIEQFCHKIAERLCEEAGKKYWFCNDYDVEIVDVCPFSGDVIALAMMRIQATVKTKGLAKSQRHPLSSQQRRQYQGGCYFVWNLDTGYYAVVETKPLIEVEPYNEVADPWNPARGLARLMRQKLPQVPVYCSVRQTCNTPALRGQSATRLRDTDNMIELVFHQEI